MMEEENLQKLAWGDLVGGFKHSSSIHFSVTCNHHHHHHPVSNQKYHEIDVGSMS
jgi:hypothetical protein